MIQYVLKYKNICNIEMIIGQLKFGGILRERIYVVTMMMS